MSENSFHKLQHNKYFVFGLVGLIAILSLILLNLSMKVSRKEAVITTNSSASEDLSGNLVTDGGSEDMTVLIDETMSRYEPIISSTPTPAFPTMTITPTPINLRLTPRPDYPTVAITPTPMPEYPTPSVGSCYAEVEGFNRIVQRACNRWTSCPAGQFNNWNITCRPSGNTYSYNMGATCNEYTHIKDVSQGLCCDSKSIFEKSMDKNKCVTSYALSIDIPCKEYAEKTGQKCQCKLLRDGQKQCCLRSGQN